MGGQKIVLAREAGTPGAPGPPPGGPLLADRLRRGDFDRCRVDEGDGRSPPERDGKLARIDARGSTDFHGGWRAGCDQLAAHLGAGQVGRCLLLTDGQANVGIADPVELAALAGAARRDRGVATSTFGVGEDFDERLLRGMADASGGRFYYIERPAQIPDLLTSELGELLQVVARDVCLWLRLPEGVEAAPLNALEAAAVGGGIQIRLGDVVSGQQLDVVVALKFPKGHTGDTVAVEFGLAEREGALVAPRRAAGWSYGAVRAVTDSRRDHRRPRGGQTPRRPSPRRGARVEPRRESKDARAILEKTARRIDAYAGSDGELEAIAAELRGEGADYAQVMSAKDQKLRYFASYSLSKDRMPDGKPRR